MAQGRIRTCTAFQKTARIDDCFCRHRLLARAIECHRNHANSAEDDGEAEQVEATTVLITCIALKQKAVNVELLCGVVDGISS